MGQPVTDRAEAAYRASDAEGRRLYNQAIFDRIWIDVEQVANVELASPFRELLELGQESTNGSHQNGADTQSRGAERHLRECPRLGPANRRTPTAVENRGGSNVVCMVPSRGALSNPCSVAETDALLGLARALADQTALRRLQTAVDGALQEAKARNLEGVDVSRREFRPRMGAIQAAILEVLSASDQPMPAPELRTVVEGRLGIPTSIYTVSSFLSVASRDRTSPVFKASRGLYAVSADAPSQ